ncbi:4Fe-4S_dicluster domain-containing protein [Hexamita inflata]|uniref:4Fe-4S dicluster domain-containing protein n=2 Tax=Hexamita inflata TaxID=28002 RepID=A0AA86R314_9EUKA|nr:4Fe-4S dicluster domain-containing protein [Hexamita inflata]CAI9969525.1 4Fe-4S dicluster domain-containing protein [Hexamita inflata]
MPDQKSYINTDMCLGCGTCEDTCSTSAITVEDQKAKVSIEVCIGCGACVDVCISGAISLVPEDQYPQK